MRIIAISDTHERFHATDKMPEGNVLIHAGDFTFNGTIPAISAFAAWLKSIEDKYERIIVIPGNHDILFERNLPLAREILCNGSPKIKLLVDEALEFDGKLFYGSPWQPEYGGWAFNLPRGEPLKRIWSRIPENTDVLITHGPPYSILDPGHDEPHVGCKDLLERVRTVRPKLHVFGHCHIDQGTHPVFFHHTKFVNASSCNNGYELVNPPVVLELP